MTQQHAPDEGELSTEERALLKLAREQAGAGVPADVRERLLGRALGEVRHATVRAVAPMQLEPVPARGARHGLAAAGALALGLTLVLAWRGSRHDGELALEQEQPAPHTLREVDGRLFRSALFHAPAPLLEGPAPAPSSSLLGESPFSERGSGWQLRRWDDLSAPPGEPVPYELARGGLCAGLGPGQRMLGGWPWAAEPEPGHAAPGSVAPGSVAPGSVAPGSVAPGSVAPGSVAPVALQAGVKYRLVFDAWAAQGQPAQLLVAVGHAQLPFSAAGAARVELASERRSYDLRFVAAHDDPGAGVAFLATAGTEPTRVCLGSVTLTTLSP